MNNRDEKALVLVVEDIEETRDGMEKLLRADGYRVAPARDEKDAATWASRETPSLLLVSLGTKTVDGIIAVRKRLGISEEIPLVIFDVDTIPEGAEKRIAANAYLARPDNFDQLRQLLRRLLQSDVPRT